MLPLAGHRYTHRNVARMNDTVVPEPKLCGRQHQRLACGASYTSKTPLTASRQHQQHRRKPVADDDGMLPAPVHSPVRPTGREPNDSKITTQGQLTGATQHTTRGLEYRCQLRCAGRSRCHNVLIGTMCLLSHVSLIEFCVDGLRCMLSS